MMTQIGPGLAFDSLTAGIGGGVNRIEIVRQNLGFDIGNSISNVALDPNVPHYYLEVRSK